MGVVYSVTICSFNNSHVPFPQERKKMNVIVHVEVIGQLRDHECIQCTLIAQVEDDLEHADVQFHAVFLKYNNIRQDLVRSMTVINKQDLTLLRTFTKAWKLNRQMLLNVTVVSTSLRDLRFKYGTAHRLPCLKFSWFSSVYIGQSFHVFFTHVTCPVQISQLNKHTI